MTKKEIILQTALHLFNQYTFTAIGIDKIIQDSSVAKMTFYKHYPSKEKLIEACLTRRFEEIQANVYFYLASCQEDDYLGKIKAIYISYLNWFKSESFNGCLFQKASINILKQYPSLDQPIISYRDWLQDLAENLFLQLGVQQTHTLSSIFINILDGMTIHANINQNYDAIEQSWKYIEQLIAFDRSSALAVC